MPLNADILETNPLQKVDDLLNDLYGAVEAIYDASQQDCNSALAELIAVRTRAGRACPFFGEARRWCAQRGVPPAETLAATHLAQVAYCMLMEWRPDRTDEDEIGRLYWRRFAAHTKIVQILQATDSSPPTRRRANEAKGKGKGAPRQYDAAADRRLVEDWKAAKSQSESRQSFCRNRGITVSDLIAAQDREKHRRRHDAE